MRCFAKIKFEAGWSYSEFLFVESAGRLKIENIFEVVKENIPELELHLSQAETEEVLKVVSKITEIFSEFRHEEILKTLTAEYSKKLSTQLRDIKKSEKLKKIYWGSMISTMKIYPPESRKRVLMEMRIEHKDSRHYLEKWLLVKEKEGWKLAAIKR